MNTQAIADIIAALPDVVGNDAYPRAEDVINNLSQPLPKSMLGSKNKGNSTLTFVSVWHTNQILRTFAPGHRLFYSDPLIAANGDVTILATLCVPTSDLGWIIKQSFGTAHPPRPEINPDGEIAPPGCRWARDGDKGYRKKAGGGYILEAKPEESMDQFTDAEAQATSRVASKLGHSEELRFLREKDEARADRLAFLAGEYVAPAPPPKRTPPTPPRPKIEQPTNQQAAARPRSATTQQPTQQPTTSPSKAAWDDLNDQEARVRLRAMYMRRHTDTPINELSDNSKLDVANAALDEINTLLRKAGRQPATGWLQLDRSTMSYLHDLIQPRTKPTEPTAAEMFDSIPSATGR